MKYLRQLCATLVLTFVLANAALAGDGIIYPGDTPPPPVPSTTGIIYPGVASPSKVPTSNGAMLDSTTEFVLNLVQTIIILF